MGWPTVSLPRSLSLSPFLPLSLTHTAPHLKTLDIVFIIDDPPALSPSIFLFFHYPALSSLLPNRLLRPPRCHPPTSPRPSLPRREGRDKLPDPMPNTFSARTVTAAELE